jgi:uncharacterized protein (DUF433 family)
MNHGQERDRPVEARISQLRGEVADGLEQARRGELIPGEDVFRKLRERLERQPRLFEEGVVDRNPEVHSGDLVFRGTRVPVTTLIDILRAGGTLEEFLEGHPTVERWQAEALLRIHGKDQPEEPKE